MSAFAEKPQLTRLPGGPVAHTRRWVADVSELCKARITLMVLVTTLVGFLFGLPDWLETTDGETVIIKTYASTLRGVGHLLADTFHRRALSKGFKHVIHALMHVDNISRERSARYGARIFRGYALMGRRLVPT